MLATAAALVTLAQAPAAPEAPPAASDVAPPAPAGPRIIAVFGDSQAEGLAVALRRVTRGIAGIKVQNHTKAGTAISQPENYNWPAAIQDYVPDAGTDTAVLMFGGNDRLPLRPAPGTTVPFRSAAWETQYRGWTAAMLHSLLDKHLRVIWVSDPICRDPRYSQDMAWLNGIYRDTLADSGATYLDIWTAVADGDGHFSPYGRALDGTTARLRLDDGIHFTPSGYDIIATRVLHVAMQPGATQRAAMQPGALQPNQPR